MSLGVGAAAAAFYVTFVQDLPSFETLSDYRPPLTSTVFDRRGVPVGEFYEFRRQLTPLDAVPRHVIQAFLAAEDDNFYEHSGVDYVSILRAAWANLRAGGETVQGASTITQQTVKQLLLSSEQTYRRKIRELILARRIEQRFSKDDILYLYLNQIYFGAGAYGVGEAARTYFDKSVSEIDAGEAALLAGLPKAPGRNSPYLDPERAEERRLYVLDRMAEEGFLDPVTHGEARANPPVLREQQPRPDFAVASYFTETIRRLLVESLGNETVLQGGLRIETTLDLPLQRDAVAAVQRGLEALDRRRGYRGPLRQVPAESFEAELAILAEKNQLVVIEGEEQPLPAEGAQLEALLLDVGKTRARAALAPGFDVELRLEGQTWARALDGPRGELGDLRKSFAAGDVVPVRIDPETPDDEEATLPRVQLAQTPDAQGALLSFEVGSGDVLALVGGYDFEDSEFDRATQATRQPGSAFKPIVYAAAMGRGYTPASIVIDRPVVIENEGFTWRPENYGRRFLGPLVVGEALARSVNNATIHLLREVGVDHVMELARRLGIESPMERNLGLALGTNPLTLLEITRAYGVFAAGGRKVRPRILLRVLDRDGQLLLGEVALGEDPPRIGPVTETAALGDEAGRADLPRGVEEPPPGPVVEGQDDLEGLPPGYAISPQQAFLATALLRQVVEHPKGTGRRALSLGHPLAGKTGTTNDQGDAWFVGYSAEVATGVWVGFDEKRVLGRGETGGRAALPIWLDMMKAVLADRPVRDFPVPDGIVFARIDGETGLLASASTRNALFQPFLEGTAPTERADQAATGSDRLRLDF